MKVYVVEEWHKGRMIHEYRGVAGVFTDGDRAEGMAHQLEEIDNPTQMDYCVDYEVADANFFEGGW